MRNRRTRFFHFPPFSPGRRRLSAFLLFFAVAAACASHFAGPRGGEGAPPRGRNVYPPEMRRLIEILSVRVERFASFARKIAENDAVAGAVRANASRDAKIAAFDRLAAMAEEMPDRWRSWGVSLDVVGISGGAKAPVAWWGELPDLDPPGGVQKVRIVADPSRLFLVVETPVRSREGEIESEPAGSVRLVVPVGRNPSLGGEFGRPVPFSEWLRDELGCDVTLYPSSAGVGRWIRLEKRGAIGRATTVGFARDGWAKRAAAGSSRMAAVLFFLLALSLLPWRSATDDSKGAAGPRAMMRSMPVFSIVAARILLALFDLPGRLGVPLFLGDRSPGMVTRQLHSPVELVLTFSVLFLAAMIVRERVASPGRDDTSPRRRRPGRALAVMLLLSAVTALFLAGLSHVVASSPAGLFAGPTRTESPAALLLESALFLCIASYLLFIDGGFLLAGRYGFPGRRVGPTLTFPVRFLIAALLGAASVALSWIAVSTGHVILLSPAVMMANALLLLFLLRGRAWRLWKGLGFVGAVALVSYAPIRAASAEIERNRVEERAVRFADREDETKRSVLEESLRFLMDDDALLADLTRPGAELDREAFHAWIRSGLSRHDYSCDLKILDRQGAVVSRFSMDMPSGSPVRAAFVFQQMRGRTGPRIFKSRRRVRGEAVEIYTGAAPLFHEGELAGAVIISIPYFLENLEYASKLSGPSAAIFRNYRTVESTLSRFPEEVEIVLYENGEVTATSSNETPSLPPPGEEIVRLVEGGGSAWRVARAADRRYDVFYTGWKDPDRKGVLAFALPRWSVVRHVFALIDLTLTCVALAALLLVLAVPAALLVSLLGGGSISRGVEFTFQDKLVVAFLLIALVPAILLAGTGRRMVGRYVREAARKEARTSLRAARYALEQETIREAEELSRSTFVRRRVLDIDEERLVDLELGLKRFGIFTPEGDLVLQNGRIGPVDSEALREVRERRAPVTYFEQGDPLTMVALVGIVIEGYENSLEGILLLSKPVNEEWALDLGERVGKDLTFFTGGVLSVSTRAELYQAGVLSGRLPAPVYRNLELKGDKVSFGWETIAGTPYLVGYGALRDFGGKPVGTLAVPLLFRDNEAQRAVSRAYAGITYLTFLTLLIIVVVAEVMGQRIARPVADLTRGMAQVRSGVLSITIPHRARGEIGRLVASFNRMTRELRRSRTALTERTRFIETILGSVAAGVIAFDRSDKIVTINAAASRILEIPVDPSQSNRGDRVQGQAVAVFGKILDRLDRSESGFLEREIELRGQGGRITLRVVASLLTDPDGNRLGKVVVFEDLTALIQSKKLVAWGEMARQVAHEIKNPLTPIKLSAQQIRRAFHDGHDRFPEILDESTELIIEEIESLRRIATEFSAFARMPRRRIEEVSPVPLVREVARLYEESAGGGVIEVTAPEDLPPIRVDREEIRRVLINLFENAVQATGGKGTITASVEIADGPPVNDKGWEVWESTSERPRKGPLLVITVTDDGPGVSEAARGKLFEPNFSTRTNGTGLGLAISRSIVEGYGGSIVIGSTAGAGSAAIVSLPV